MAQIKGIDTMTGRELGEELERGGRFVYFMYCVSIVVMTFRRTSPIYFIRSTEKGWHRGLPYTLLSFFVGWWGVPWGFIYTPECLFVNLSGGKDVTREVMAQLTVEATA